MYGLGFSYGKTYPKMSGGITPVAPQITSGPIWNAHPRVGEALDVSPGTLNSYFPTLTTNTFAVFDGDPAGSGVSIYGPQTLTNVRAYLAESANEGATLHLQWSVANSEGSVTASAAAPGVVLPAFAAPSANLNADLMGRTISAWLTAINGEPAAPPALDAFTVDDGNGAIDISGTVSGAGTVGDPWIVTLASDETALDISITASLDNGVGPAWLGTDSTITIPADLGLSVALDSAPVITGTGVEGEILLSDGSDTWTYGGALATVTAREYRLLVDGVVVGGPQPAPELSIPTGTAGAPYSYQIRVTLSEGPNTQSGWTTIANDTVAAALVAPSVTASDSLAGRRLTIGVESLTGNPMPSVALTALTLDGADVRGGAAGTGPWTYDVPSSAATQDVAWEVTASSSQGSDTALGSEPVTADLAAPSATLNTDLTARVVIAWLTDIAGTPIPLPVLDVFTAAGSDVTGSVTGSGTPGNPWSYVVPSGGSATEIVIGASLDNGVAPIWSETNGTISVPADQTAPVVTVALAAAAYTAGEVVDASDIEPTIADAGEPVLQMADLALVLMVNGLPVSFPHVANEGEVLVPRVTGNHPSGNIDVFGNGVTVASALTLTQTADGEVEIDGATGTITVTITSPAIYADYDAGNGAGLFVFDGSDLATGPVNLVPPQIMDDGSPVSGETQTVIPGLWMYDPDTGGLGTPVYQWQSDTAGNGTFADISGATSNSYTLTSDESGDGVRVQESLANNGGSRTANSAAVSVAAAVPGAFVDANWSVATKAGAALDVTIATLPADNGAAITDVEYDLGASGTWVSSGGTVSFAITGLTASTSYDVRLRAVNSAGSGTAGNTETAATSGSASVDPEAGLTQDATFTVSQVVGIATPNRSQSVVFACDFTGLDGSAGGLILEHGGAGNGSLVCFNTDGTFVIRGGNGADPTAGWPAGCAYIEMASGQPSGDGTLVWEFNASTGAARAWWNDVPIGTPAGALSGGVWTGGDNGTYLGTDPGISRTGITAHIDDPAVVVPYTTASPLRVYYNEVSSA